MMWNRRFLYVTVGMLALVGSGSMAYAQGGYGPVVIGVDSVPGSPSLIPVGTPAYGSDAAELSIKHHAGLLDFGGDYVSTKVLAPGSTIVRNFNLYDGATLVETLNIVLTGESPDRFDPDNMSFDVHARSNYFGLLTPLPDGPITLLYNLQVPRGWFNLSPYIEANGGPSDFELSVEVLAPAPEPGSITLLFSVSLIGSAFGWLRRRRSRTTNLAA